VIGRCRHRGGDPNAAGVTPEEVDAGARRLLAQTCGHQLAEALKQSGLGQKAIAPAMGVTVARVSHLTSVMICR
jgi:predicted XRE-type DNA-binding protein